MNKYRPPSIEQIGLKKYLNQTAKQHNGSDYAEFEKRLGLDEPKSVIARAFGVDPRTVGNWIEVYQRERSRNVSQR